MAQNPNMLRTLIGLGLTLIIILSYAVYSATVDTSYYLYHFDTEEQSPVITYESGADDNTSHIWSFTTEGALTWINISAEGLPAGSVMTVETSAGEWWSHEMLGSDEATRFSCRELTSDFELINVCHAASSHSTEADGDGVAILRGLGSPDLPLTGLGSINALSVEDAESYALEMENNSYYSRLWTITIESDDAIYTELVDITALIVNNTYSHTVMFQVDPFTELMWSITALISCFGMALFIPVSVYIASRAKEKRDERIRLEAEGIDSEGPVSSTESKIEPSDDG
jgi:hypothetical protein